MERLEADHSACGIAVSGLALPAVPICQPRSAKRCVSVEGQGQQNITNQMSGTAASFIALDKGKDKSTVKDGPRLP